MQIGEFAKICSTRISVLRHYDKLGLLIPSYTEPFTGYRYYSADQITDFLRISALKQAGFSLAEIRDILVTVTDDGDILRLFERRQAELMETLENLNKAKKMILEGVPMIHVIFKETTDGITACTTKVNDCDFGKACEKLDEAVATGNYQRISGFRSLGEPLSGEVEAVCDVVKLTDRITVPLNDNADIPFENDETLVGKWQIVGQYAVKEDFYADREHLKKGTWYGEKMKELYFLPGGEQYWCYRWTKGKLICRNGDGTAVNPFESAEYDGDRYLFVQWKSYCYRRGGKPVILVLRQLDHRAYTKEEIMHRDDVDLPFVQDAAVHGRWTAHSAFREREQFDPSETDDRLFWTGIEFSDDGSCMSSYGERVVSNTWTKGYVLDKRQHTASAYEIVHTDGADYLIIQWKNGDYTYGGYLPGYYAFVKEKHS